MYLSRLLLNSRSADVRRDFRNIHDVHRRVLAAFPDLELIEKARKEFEILFRVDTSAEGNLSLLVQSLTMPDWSCLPSGYLQDCFEPNPASTELATLLQRIQPGLRLRFRLRVNATKRLRSDSDKRGKRVELVGAENLVAWLNRKAAAAGFELCIRDSNAATPAVAKYAVRVTREGKVRGHRSGVVLTFGSTLFDGDLVVTNAAAFCDALKAGLGSAKAYGFGLLSVAPA